MAICAGLARGLPDSMRSYAVLLQFTTSGLGRVVLRRGTEMEWGTYLWGRQI